MLIVPFVCAEFHDRYGNPIYTIKPNQLMTIVTVPDAIRQDPLYELLVADQSIRVPETVEELRRLENDPVPKPAKAEKADKSEKTDKTSKTDRSDDAAKSEKTDKPAKTERSARTAKTAAPADSKESSATQDAAASGAKNSAVESVSQKA